MKIHTPWSLDADRSRNHYVISDAEGNVAALVPGEENDAEPHNAPEDAEAKARAEAIVAAVNATQATDPQTVFVLTEERFDVENPSRGSGAVVHGVYTQNDEAIDRQITLSREAKENELVVWNPEIGANGWEYDVMFAIHEQQLAK